MIKKAIIVFLFYYTTSFAQLYDLCGIWVGHNYNCYTINPDNTINDFYYKTELIEIKQDGTHITATKIIGDDCVTNGNITWQGDYTQSTFEAAVTIGTPIGPNSAVAIGVIMSVENANTIKSSFGVEFIRATCSQIDSFNVNLSSLNIECNVICDVPLIIMPNAFTPNKDGKNDSFMPGVFRNVVKAQMLIYDRWGELMFETNEPLNGWDGKRGKDNCPSDVYICTINYTDFNNKTYTYKGTVVLLD